MKQLWTEKYRPNNLNDYIFQNDNHKKIFLKFFEEKSIPHLLLSGTAGSGKTTIAKIIITHLIEDETDVLVINASDENSVDTIRNKISVFASTYAMGPFKIILLDECDYITPAGQAALRNLMEEYSDNCRFILTCNYDNKIIPAIKSRIQHLDFKTPSKDEVFVRCATILFEENIAFDETLLQKFVDVGYPDIRKTIGLLEQYSDNNTLSEPSDASDSSDYQFKILELLETGNFRELRKVVTSNVSREEYEGLYRFMYENIHKVPKFEANVEIYEQSLVVIASYLYKNSLVADQEINAAAMFIELGQL